MTYHEHPAQIAAARAHAALLNNLSTRHPEVSERLKRSKKESTTVADVKHFVKETALGLLAGAMILAPYYLS